MKPFFGLVNKNKAANVAANIIVKSLSSFFSSTIPNGIVTYGYNDAGDQLNAYATVDDLYSIVRKIAKTCKRIPFYVYEIKSEKEFGKYRLMQRKAQQNGYSIKTMWDIKELQTKSLEIIGEQDPLQMLLDNPNSFQSKDEFYEAAYTFPLLTGNEYIFMNVLDAGANANQVFDMYHLPPNYTFPVRSNTFPRTIIAYEWIMGGIQILQTTNVIHRKYFNPIYDFNGNELVGLSPLHAAQKTLTQIGNERDFMNNALKNSGAGGFMSMEDDLSIEAWNAIKEDVLKEIGGINDARNSNVNAKKIAALAGKWKYNPINLSPADMDLVKQSFLTFKKMCNVFGVSDIWFNSDTASTESNVREMVKQAYTNCVLPEVTSMRDALQNNLVYYKNDLGIKLPRYNDGVNRIIDYDATDIVELQEDMANVTARFNNMPAFRVNDLFEAVGFGKLDDPNADVVLVKQGYVPLADAVLSMGASNDITDLGALDGAGANDYGK